MIKKKITGIVARNRTIVQFKFINSKEIPIIIISMIYNCLIFQFFSVSCNQYYFTKFN